MSSILFSIFFRSSVSSSKNSLFISREIPLQPLICSGAKEGSAVKEYPFRAITGSSHPSALYFSISSVLCTQAASVFSMRMHFNVFAIL